MQQKSYKAWAVEWRWPNDDRRFFVGRYFFTHAIPDSLHGHVICAFKTRREAREAVRNKSYGKPRIIRVNVTMRRCR